MRKVLLSIALAGVSTLVVGEPPFETSDPLLAFVYRKYSLGSDYFIHGADDTTLLRCVADFNHDGRPDIALSEKSIWGNRTGPFEIFLRVAGERFRYSRTADYETELQAQCSGTVESCSSKEYLSTKACTWKRGW